MWPNTVVHPLLFNVDTKAVQQTCCFRHDDTKLVGNFIIRQKIQREKLPTNFTCGGVFFVQGAKPNFFSDSGIWPGKYGNYIQLT
jgi:hypothetical protein